MLVHARCIYALQQWMEHFSKDTFDMSTPFSFQAHFKTKEQF